jgi:hypothetical protein
MFAVKRRLFNVLAAVSLGLLVATTIVTARSLFASDALDVNCGQRHFRIITGKGGVSLRTRTGPGLSGWNHVDFAARYPAYFPLGESFGGRCGIQFGMLSSGYSLTAPIWPVPAIMTPLVLVVVFRSRRRAGTCASCGYDLRATPERCPECGTAVKPTA